MRAGLHGSTEDTVMNRTDRHWPPRSDMFMAGWQDPSGYVHYPSPAAGGMALHPCLLELHGSREPSPQREDASIVGLSNNSLFKLTSTAAPGPFGQLSPVGQKAKHSPCWQDFNHSSVDENQGCFWLLATVDKAAIRILAHDFLRTYVPIWINT